MHATCFILYGSLSFKVIGPVMLAGTPFNRSYCQSIYGLPGTPTWKCMYKDKLG